MLTLKRIDQSRTKSLTVVSLVSRYISQCDSFFVIELQLVTKTNKVSIVSMCCPSFISNQILPTVNGQLVRVIRVESA
jgi:hypothetical protein